MILSVLISHASFKMHVLISNMDACYPLSGILWLNVKPVQLTFSKALEMNKMVQKPIIRATLDI